MEDYKTVMHGRWWDRREMKEFSGDLVIEDGRIHLHVSETKSKEHIWDSVDNAFDVVFGETIDGGAVTIFGCYPVSATQKSSGFTRYEFECEEAWFGSHIHDKDSVECKAIYAEIPDLDLWMKKKSYSSMSRNSHAISSDFSISFNLTEEYYYKVINNIDIHFISLNRPNFLSKNFELSSTFTVKISPLGVSGFHDLMGEVNKYVILLSILYGRIITPVSIHMEVIVGGQVSGISLCPPFPKKKSRRSPQTIAFFFPEVVNKIPSMAGIVGEMLNQYREPLAMLFLNGNSYASNSQDVIRRNFLDLCHVVEGIANELPSSKIIDGEDFKEFRKKVEALLCDVNNGTFVNINRDRIGRWNEQVLAGKLEGFIFGFQERFTSAIGMTKGDISKVVSTRNYYAHMSAKKSNKVVGYAEMANYNWKILFMLYVHLLKCLGIGESDATYNIGSTEQFHGVLDFDIYNS